jgi:S-disulfanyl-L-cysteine oxidoreductase SoxD
MTLRGNHRVWASVVRSARVVALLSLSVVLVVTGHASAQPQEPAPAEVRSILDGVFTARQARRGERWFVQICEQCHRTRDFTNAQFHERWAGQSVGDLLQFMQYTMPPENPGALSTDRYADVLAFFLAANDYPPGEEEIPADAASVMDLRIVAPPTEDSGEPPATTVGTEDPSAVQ